MTHAPEPSARRHTVFVVSAQVGEVGGAARATLLLAEALTQIGFLVRLYVTVPVQPEVKARLARSNVRVVPVLGGIPQHHLRGWRWSIPHRLLAWRVAFDVYVHRPYALLSMSLSTELRHLLSQPLPLRARVLAWETTEALPHVDFVDQSIGRYLSRVSALLVPSGQIAQNARPTYGFEGPIYHLPFWTEEPSIPPQPKPRGETLRLLFLGRLSFDKGLRELVTAFERVRDRRPNIRLVVGGGGETDEVRELFASHASIEYVGFVPPDRFEAIFAASDAVVLPSKHEGYPLSLLEACARGLPVIATRVGSIPTLFEGRPCALLVPASDPLALEAAIETFAADDDVTWERRSRDARTLFNEVSSPAVVHASLRAVLEGGASSL